MPAGAGDLQRHVALILAGGDIELEEAAAVPLSVDDRPKPSEQVRGVGEGPAVPGRQSFDRYSLRQDASA